MFFINLEKFTTGEKIPRHSHGEKAVWFGNLRVASLLFADYLVLLASSNQDVQRALEWFDDKCKVAGMRISSYKSEAMVLNRQKVQCPLWAEESLPQAEEFKCLGILFTSDGRLEKEMDIRTGALPAVITGLLWSVLVKRELRREGEAFNLLVHHFYNPHLWSRDVGRERQDKTADTSGLNGFPSENGRTYP